MKRVIIILVLCLVLFGCWFFLRNDDTDDVYLEDTSDDLTTSLKSEKYYIDDYLDRYLNYADSNDFPLSQVVAYVNSNLDRTQYVDVSLADGSYDDLILVNKYYYLSDDYVPDDLVSLSSGYSCGVNNMLRKVAADHFMMMADAALLDNVVLKNASGYRSYSYQDNLYNRYVERDGKESADLYSARAGFSEHQTGLALDINQIDDGFESTDAFRWLSENAYKYGFILRYPKDKELITGYQYESWHYRYVGEDVALKIYNEGITFEEYFAYYVKK